MKSEYTSNRKVAVVPEIPIATDDPRLDPYERAITESTIGGPINEIGLDGKSLRTGGTNFYNPSGEANAGTVSDGGNFTPPTNGQGSINVGFGAIVPANIANLDTVWDDEDLVITFTWDPNSPANATVSEFILEVTEDGVKKQSPYGSFLVNRSQTNQTVRLTKVLNAKTLGTFSTAITSVCVFAIDAFYNKSSSVCDTSVPAYVPNLPIPDITVSHALNGYNVVYTIPTQGSFDAIEIVEYESPTTPPSNAVYSRVFFDNISPANIITLNTQKRWVKARFTLSGGSSTLYCAPKDVVPLAPVTVDNTGPTAPTSGIAIPGIDNSSGATIGFNAYVDLSWSAVSDTTLRGYRIRFRENGTSNAYSYVDSPGPGTSFRLSGLAIGTVYSVEIAAYDEFNNTSPNGYFSLGTAQATGTPFIGKNVTTVGYFGASATGDTGTFKFGYGVQDSGGVKRGLVFNSNNYWYIDSAQAASLKVGGTDNYVSWNGSSLIVAGDLQAKKGSFSGNVNLASGASLYSGTLTGNTVTPTGDTGGSLSSAGYILNINGLTFSNGLSGNALRQTTIAAASGLLTTNSANIGGWIIEPGVIRRDQAGQGRINIDSTNGYIQVSSDNVANKTAGINSASSNTGVVFWAGGSSPTDALNSFTVKLDGSLYAQSATVAGTIRATAGGFGAFDTGNNVAKGWNIDNNGIQAIGAGRIKLGNYSIKSLNGTDFSIYDDSQPNDSATLLTTNTVANATDPKRIFLGDLTRQVEVAKSAQIEGNGAGANLTLTPTSSSDTINAYRSGGLRNIFTLSQGVFISHSTGNGTLDGITRINDYPSSIKGDVLVVYDSSTPTNGVFKKIVGMYLNTEGLTGLTYYYATYTENRSTGTCTSAPALVSTTQTLPTGATADTVFVINPLSSSYQAGYYSTISSADAIAKLYAHSLYCSTAPVIATTSTLTTGNSGASIEVTSTNFAQTVSISDFTVSVGTTGLTLLSVTNTSTSSKTLVFNGTVSSGTLQITAKASAYSPVASSDSNTLSVVASANTTTTTTTTTTTAAPTTWYCSTSSNVTGNFQSTETSNQSGSVCDQYAIACSTSGYPAYPAIPACPTTAGPTTTTTASGPNPGDSCGTATAISNGPCDGFGSVRSAAGACYYDIFMSCVRAATFWDTDCMSYYDGALSC